MRQTLARGALLMTGVSLVSRTLSFLAQLALGKLLLKGDFGLYAMALGLTGIGGALRSVLQPVLVELLAKDQEAFRRIYRTSLLSVSLFAAALALGSGAIEAALSEPGLQRLLIPMAILMPFQVLPVFGLSALNYELEFPTVSRVLTASVSLRYIVTVAAAFVGFGPLSFVVGTAAATATELGALRKRLTVRPGLWSSQTLSDVATSVSRFRDVAASRRWIWASAIASTMAIYGDYVAASVSLGAVGIGLYYFAYSLVGAVYQPLNVAVNSVLVPGFVRLETVSARRDRLQEIIRLAAALGTVFFGLATVTVAPLTGMLWGGKWDEAIPAMIGFLIFAPLQLLHPIVLAVARGSGYWTLFFTASVATGVATFSAAFVGAWFGGLTWLVVFVVVADVFVTLTTVYRLCTRLAVPFGAIARSATQPWLIGILGLGIAHLVYPLHEPNVARSWLPASLYLLTVVPSIVLIYRADLGGFVRSVMAGARSSAQTSVF